MFQYYSKHGVTLNYDISQVNVYGYKSTLSPIAAGGNGYILTDIPPLPQTDHDIVMFVFDLNEWKASWYWPYPLRWDMPRSSTSLVNGKPFINLGFYDKDPQGNQMVILHEPMHALAKIFNCPDQIDNYFKNNLAQYQDPDSSMSIQWGIFKPFLMPLQTSTSPVQPNPLDKWGLVSELETLAGKFLQQCLAKGYSLKITQGLRTLTQQQALYNQGRTTPGKIVTNAKPGESAHNFGKAFDVAFTGSVPYPTDDKLWKAIADIGVSLGLTAGYYFKSFQDKPHYEI